MAKDRFDAFLSKTRGFPFNPPTTKSGLVETNADILILGVYYFLIRLHVALFSNEALFAHHIFIASNKIVKVVR